MGNTKTAMESFADHLHSFAPQEKFTELVCPANASHISVYELLQILMGTLQSEEVLQSGDAHRFQNKLSM